MFAFAVLLFIVIFIAVFIMAYPLFLLFFWLRYRHKRRKRLAREAHAAALHPREDSDEMVY